MKETLSSILQNINLSFVLAVLRDIAVFTDSNANAITHFFTYC